MLSMPQKHSTLTVTEEMIPFLLKLHKPQFNDLWFRQQMLSDEETMSYNHSWDGTISFPEEVWNDWYNYWLVNNGDLRYYRYVKNEEGLFLGEIAYHYDDEIHHMIANVLILSRFRGKGYGGQALDLLCDAAMEHGVTVLYDDIAADNPAIQLFLKHGFTLDHRTDQKVYLKKELS